MTTLCLTAPATVVSAQSVALAASAIERHNSVSLHNWRFDRVKSENGKTQRERCIGVDFHKANCRLMSIDGQEPSEEQLAAYAEEFDQPVENNLPNIDLTQFFDAKSVIADGGEDGVARYSFEPVGETPEDQAFMSRQRGSLEVDREEGYVAALRIDSNGAFKPATGVKIKSFAMHIDFAEIDDTVFASSVRVSIRGRAFMVKKIEQDEVVRFENFTPPI